MIRLQHQKKNLLTTIYYLKILRALPSFLKNKKKVRLFAKSFSKQKKDNASILNAGIFASTMANKQLKEFQPKNTSIFVTNVFMKCQSLIKHFFYCSTSEQVATISTEPLFVFNSGNAQKTRNIDLKILLDYFKVDCINYWASSYF